MIRSLFLSFGLLCLLNCQTQKTTDSNSSSTSTNQKNIELELGKSIKIVNTNLIAKYLGITEDSRCPEGVTCVWQGLAIVEVEIKTPASKPQTIHLSTMDFEPLKAQKTEPVFGYNITLENVLPGRKSDENQKEAKNHITVSVQKVD